MMKLKTFTCLLLLTLAALPLRAQFNLPGDEPARLRWYSIETPYYQIIYPEGADSLARIYGTRLEQFRKPTGLSLGEMPGGGQPRKMPVVLHTHNVYSNGSVSWAPTRFDLYTLPDAYGSDPSPWEVQLASHEPRHQAQLQWGGNSWFKPFTWVIGQGWNPIAWILYFDSCIGEGDAVNTETGLWKGNRAWTADFLNYYRVAFDQGDTRCWSRWRFGSFKHYTPDVYALGYLVLSGSQTFYDRPLILQDALQTSRKKPWRMSPSSLFTQINKSTGKKKFKESLREIQDTYQALWEEDREARGPFMPMEQVTEDESFATDFDSPFCFDGQLYLFRSGFIYNKELVRWDGNSCKTVRPFASHVSQPSPEPVRRRLYWSETVQDKRWTLAGTSRLRYLDMDSGKTHDLTREGRLYTPQPSPDGSRLAAIDYPVNGGSALVVVSADDGQLLARYPAPDGIQLTEVAWMGEDFYATGISARGTGLYRTLPEGGWAEELAPSIQKVINLESDGENCLQWVSDRDGSNQFYTYYLAQKRLVQETSARYGATDFCVSGDTLYSIAQTLNGAKLFRTALKDLQPREVSYAQTFEGRVERTLREQASARGEIPDLSEAVPLSAPRRYYKWQHPLRIHTWAPLYANYDAIMSGSYDLSYETAAIGATGFFQNTLGSLSGSLGYGFHQDPDHQERWRHSLHVKAAYTGWYPVIEASFDLGDQQAYQYYLVRLQNHDAFQLRNIASERTAPLATGTVRAYIPLSLNKGGVLNGIIPQVSYTLSNHLYESGAALFEVPDFFAGLPASYRLTGFEEGHNQLMQFFSASVRGYSMLPRTKSQTYPRWGIGAEAGLSFRPGLEGVFTPVFYAYSYAYLPGLWRPQGLRLTGTLQQQLWNRALMIGERRTSTLPRGFSSKAATAAALQMSTQWKVTADYAIPIYVGDLNLMPVTYIKNFVLTPHADFSGLGAGRNLWSAGADLIADFSAFIISFKGSVGVSFSYLGGSWYEASGQEKPYQVDLIFKLDL